MAHMIMMHVAHIHYSQFDMPTENEVTDKSKKSKKNHVLIHDTTLATDR